MRLRLLRLAIVGALLLLNGASSVLAQQIFHSREDFHNNTDYGTLAFNQDALTQFQNRYEFKNFIVLSDGRVNLPRQSAYCFLLNHYNSPHSMQNYTYTFSITRWFADGTSAGKDVFSDTYEPTDNAASFLYPDYCARSIANWGKVEIQTSSSEGFEFKHDVIFEKGR